MGQPDDAAVWRLDARRALVVTADFFTPIVDDPKDFGEIAAANALSDLYAMGAEPFLALNLLAIPADLPPDLAAEILAGGAAKVREAGAVLAGGHSLQDREPKYGLVALGMADPERLLTKGGARVGDVLVLTKPIGTGLVATAMKHDRCRPEHAAEAIAWMKRLNARPARAALECGVRSATDITGFGLAGHLAEMVRASGTGAELFFESLPVLPGALDYARAGEIPGGTEDNRRYFGVRLDIDESIGDPERTVLFDAQTSGGILLSVPASALPAFLTQSVLEDLPHWAIGRITSGDRIRVRPGRLETTGP